MKKKIALILSAVMILALAFSVTGCGGGSDAEGVNVEGDTIKIGVFEPTTGENGGGGMQEVLGIRYANQLNPTVEVGGQDLQHRISRSGQPVRQDSGCNSSSAAYQ